MANLPISAKAFYCAYQSFYNDGAKDSGTRLGQYLCNTFNITDDILYYEPDDTKASNLFPISM